MSDDPFLKMAASSEGSGKASSRLKSRIFSTLTRQQEESGPLLSLRETSRAGSQLCIFEQLVQIAPVGEKLHSFNYCRICHARALAERIEAAPIWWPGCPYVLFQGGK
ncbi:MAG: hypothetical protein HY235_07365 [Acidobacteria bacterium]|nr:hypothetical protein [Acidobacteriota bacterium]